MPSELENLAESQFSTIILCPGRPAEDNVSRGAALLLGFPSHLQAAAGPVLLGK